MGLRAYAVRTFSGMLILAAAAAAFEFSDFGRNYAEFRRSVEVSSPADASGSPGQIRTTDITGRTESEAGAESRETTVAGPNPEIRKRLAEMVRESRRSVVFSIYVLTDSEVVDALSDAAKRGVSVRGITERNVFQIPNANRKARDRLLSAGADVKSPKDDPFAYFHAKYLVTDASRYVVSTGNYAKTSLSKNREFFVFGDDAEMAAFLTRVFEADFSGIPYAAEIPARAYLAPYDARSKLGAFIAESRERIEILAPSLSDAETLSALSRRAEAGVRVSVCLPDDADVEVARDKLSPKVRITASSGPFLHAKAALSDGRALWVGSLNFTTNSIDRNREIGFVRTDLESIRTYETTLRTDCKW